MALSIRTSVRTARAAEINTALGGGAKVKFYSGAAPASVNVAATGTLLAEAICNATAFGVATNGVLSASTVAGQSYVARDSSANATGNVGYARITDSADNAVLQESDVGTSGNAITMPSITITATEPVEVNSIVITEGNA